ncbi:MAG: polyprenyl synthetase family protein [Marinifilaceae bacterium]
MHSFKELQEIVQQKLDDQNFVVAPEGLFEPMDYILAIGGKRIRPIMVLMGADLYSKNLEDVILPALGIEIFHNFTLLHDDVMDNAPMRRNRATVHEKWNSNVAILSGDAMSIKAYQYIVSCNERYLRPVLDVFNQTALEVCEGQQYDMEFESRDDVAVEEYLEMIRLKTAVLLGGSLKMGAVMGDASDRDADLLYQFGVNLGMAFQLQDDLLDVYGNEKEFGKKIGGDIVANKKTYLLIKALELANGDLLDQLKEQLEAKEFDRDEKIKVVKGIYNQLQVKELSQELIDRYIARSIDCLDQVKVEDSRKQVLRDLVDRMLNRTH